jgi:hypothetical protein
MDVLGLPYVCYRGAYRLLKITTKFYFGDYIEKKTRLCDTFILDSSIKIIIEIEDE